MWELRPMVLCATLLLLINIKVQMCINKYWFEHNTMNKYIVWISHIDRYKIYLFMQIGQDSNT